MLKKDDDYLDGINLSSQQTCMHTVIKFSKKKKKIGFYLLIICICTDKIFSPLSTTTTIKNKHLTHHSRDIKHSPFSPRITFSFIKNWVFIPRRMPEALFLGYPSVGTLQILLMRFKENPSINFVHTLPRNNLWGVDLLIRFWREKKLQVKF